VVLGPTIDGAWPGGWTPSVDPGETVVAASAAWPPAPDEIPDGVSVAEVAARYGVTVGVVRRWLEDDPAALGRTGRDVGWLRDAYLVEGPWGTRSGSRHATRWYSWVSPPRMS
jgi:hypothetical protein